MIVYSINSTISVDHSFHHSRIVSFQFFAHDRADVCGLFDKCLEFGLSFKGEPSFEVDPMAQSGPNFVVSIWMGGQQVLDLGQYLIAGSN